MTETTDKELIRNRARQRRMLGHYALIVFNFLIVVILFQKMNFMEFDTPNQIREHIRNLKISSLKIENLVTELRYRISYDYNILLNESKKLKENITKLESVSRDRHREDDVHKVIWDVFKVVTDTGNTIQNVIAKHEVHVKADKEFHAGMKNAIGNLLTIEGSSSVVNAMIRLEEQALLYSLLRSEEALAQVEKLLGSVAKGVKSGEQASLNSETRKKVEAGIKGVRGKVDASKELHDNVSLFLTKYDGQIYDQLNTIFERSFSSEGESLNRIILLFYIVLIGSWLHVAYLIYEILKRNSKIQHQTQELQDSLEQQKDLNDLQRKFVSMVSHEFRTPLAIIDSGAQKLIRRAETLTPKKIEEVAYKTRAHINKLIELLDSILHSQRMDAGAMEIMPGPCDLKLIIGDVCQLQYEIHTRNVIVLNISSLPSQIIADSKLIGHVFTNLISNAVKYSPDGTEVHINGGTFDDYVEITIKDSGVGIPEDELPDLFSCFYRASTSVGISGTGIGLHLVKTIIDEHGGSIEVESEVGVGSSFTVRLPLTQANYKPIEEAEISEVA